MKEIDAKTFVRKKFAEYYQTRSSAIKSPTSIEKREFGFLLFREKIMLRHKGFRNIDGLRSFLKRMIPSDVFHSSAYYEKPEAEMEGKEWLGADLIFDIDADHIPTPCPKTHDMWVCNDCGAVRRGSPPENCPVCSAQKFIEKTWPCEICLASAKTETLKLIDLLMKDFGISSKEMTVAFSGHRGYHIHVAGREIRWLDALARKEVVDYVGGIGLETVFHGLTERGVRNFRGPDLYDPAWRGRIAKGVYDLLLTFSREDPVKIGLTKKTANLITEHRETILESWGKNGPWGMIEGIGIDDWRKIARRGVENQSVKIDSVVTTDVHRLIRFTNTLHGKTGLKKTEVPVTDLDHFDPFKSSIAFKKGTVTVFVWESPQFRMEDEVFGPYRNQEVELPTSAAIFLICKGLARMKGETRGVRRAF